MTMMEINSQSSMPRTFLSHVCHLCTKISNFLQLGSIVFVHGITGSQTGTWTMKNEEGKEVLWPRELLTANDQIPGSRIIMFGYDADVVNFWAEASQNRLSDHADSLVGTLGALRRRTNTVRPIFQNKL
jgi:hypothetical protein